MIYVGDIGTMVKITLDNSATIIEGYVHTSYNKKKYRMIISDIDKNIISFVLPDQATLKPGLIQFELVTSIGRLTTKDMVVNVKSRLSFEELKEAVTMGVDWHSLKVNTKDSYEEDDYFIIN